jgi:hypothetical protein
MMMIPTIIKENTKKEYPDGSYIKQYVVYAPEWDIYLDNDGHKIVPHSTLTKINHFVISESTRMGHLEVLVFPCDDQGVCAKMIEIMGGRDYTADQVLCSFGSMMMEAGYDTV